MQVKWVWINNVMIVASDHKRGSSENSWVLVVWEMTRGYVRLVCQVLGLYSLTGHNCVDAQP